LPYCGVPTKKYFIYLKYAQPMLQTIEQLLGAEKTAYLLQHRCTTVPKDQLYLPGGDFVDRVWSGTNRNIQTLRSMQTLHGHGRLANSGYLSSWVLTNTTEATTSSLDCKLLGLSQRNPNNAFGAYAVWNVLINSHLYRGGVTGV